MKIYKMGILLGIVCVMTMSSWADPIKITFTGTCDGTDGDPAWGYTFGDAATFTFVINDGYTQNPMDQFTGELYEWAEMSAQDSPFILDVYGDGLTGSFTQPSSPFSRGTLFHETVMDTHNLSLMAFNDEVAGLQTDGGRSIESLELWNWQITPGPAYSGTYTSPETLFNSLAGTYNTSATVMLLSGSGSAVFESSQIVIEPVPEPSVIGLLSLCSLGLLGVRRIFMV